MVGGFADRSAISAAPTRRRRQTPLQGKGDDRTQRQTAARGIGTQLRQHVARNLERRRHRRFADRYDMGNRPCVLQIPIRLPPRNATLLNAWPVVAWDQRGAAFKFRAFCVFVERVMRRKRIYL
jgi:hypothetical protein